MAINYNSQIVTNGLVSVYDAANPKSFSQNVHPKPTDLYGWITTGNNCTLSRDTIQSPVGNTPLKMVQTGNDTFTGTYNLAAYNLAPAVAGQTWTVSVWAKASAPIACEGPWVAEHNASGAYLAGGGSPNIAVLGTEWTRISGTYTLVNASTAYVAVRLDGTNASGAGVTIWWDGLQLELGSSATAFNPKTNTNRSNVNNIVLPSSSGTVNNVVPVSSNFSFNGTSQYLTIPTSLPAGQTRYTLAAWWYTTKNSGIQSVVDQSMSTVTTNKRAAILIANAAWGFNGESNDAHDKVPVRLNQWVYGVVTVDTTETTNPIKIYENGVLYWQGNSSNTAANLVLGADVSTIGRKAAVSGEFFQGNIAHVSVYNKVLTNAEIWKNFTALRGRFGV